MVRYWLAGTHARPHDLNQRLAALLDERADKIEGAIAQLRATEEGQSHCE